VLEKERLTDQEKDLEEGPMIILLVVILAFILLDIAAVRWGVDSTDRLDSKEWERRQRQALAKSW
jgi:hypothetical protein